MRCITDRDYLTTDNLGARGPLRNRVDFHAFGFLDEFEPSRMEAFAGFKDVFNSDWGVPVFFVPFIGASVMKAGEV